MVHVGLIVGGDKNPEASYTVWRICEIGLCNRPIGFEPG